MFHHTRKLLKKSYFQKLVLAYFSAAFVLFNFSGAIITAADKPEKPASFDPVKGFKPAQSDLTEVFLQIAGSLEYYGSPEPYFRHMKAEHARIEAKYQQQLAKKPSNFCPAYMDDAYFDRFAANWKHMAPQLGLESLAKTTGHLMRLAINGTDGKGTIIVEVFNQHQHAVYMAMTGKKAVSIPDFDSLKGSMSKFRWLDDATTKTNLTPEQQAVVNPANDIHTAFLKLFSALDAGLPTGDAEKVKTVIVGIVTDVGQMAQSELEAGIVDEYLNDLISPPKPYTADSETALNATEKSTLTAFLKKSRFTRADFSALDQFYSNVFDKLSARGKAEMNFRVKAGMIPDH